MYENITYESILKRMLEKIPSNIDKREGSIIYDALAPCAVELQLMYIELDVILTETFGSTASREYLILRALERGLTPSASTYAILKGEFNKEIEISSRFSCGDLNYFASEFIEKVYIDDSDTELFYYKIQCESLGVVGNRNFGDLISIDYIDGLTYAQLVDLLIPGEDEEDTEDFRERYLNSFNSKAYGGNIEDYLQKTNSIAGVGATKVTPVWNGGGTVLLTILNSEFDIASDILIDTVQQEIDPTKDGYGVGVAPIGHIVTVRTCDEVSVNISLNITYSNGYYFDRIKGYIEDTINEYLQELKLTWADEDYLVVRITQIESRLLNIQGVVDISNTKLNNVENNLTLETYEIPTLGVIN